MNLVEVFLRHCRGGICIERII